jgi:hypothetical protein
LKRLSFSPSYVLGNFVKNEVGIAIWIYVWVSYSILLVFASVFVPVPCCFYCYGSVVQFEVGYCNTSRIALFVQFLFNIFVQLFVVFCVSIGTLGLTFQFQTHSKYLTFAWSVRFAFIGLLDDFRIAET